MESVDVAAWIQAISGVVSAAVTVAVALMVHSYTTRKDKTAIIHEMWRQQQDWNMQAASSPLHARAAELMVYGGAPADKGELNALRSCLFFFINRVNHIYDAYCNGILSRADFLSEASGTIALVAGQKSFAIRLIENRGYDQGFASEIVPLIKSASTAQQVDPPIAIP